MKINKLAFGLLAATMMAFSSCSNDYPTFDDADAFVAMTSSSAFVAETGDSLVVPVMLTSLSGLEKTVEFTLTPDSVSGAVEGTHYVLMNESKTLTFTKAQPTQYIKFKIIDNNVFTGNVKFTISLVQPAGLNLGANKNCVVTIEDDEHPLAFILGTYGASADSYFSSRGHFDWDITISRDESDVTKVWIGDLDPYFAKYGYTAANGYNTFYGTVNENKTQILIPVGQKLGYDETELAAFAASDPDEDETEADNIVIDIQDNGNTLVITNAWGIYDDGWWNLFRGPITLKKK